MAFIRLNAPWYEAMDINGSTHTHIQGNVKEHELLQMWESK